MTAVLGILNKQAVAIAADSAVTVGGPENHKIFNRANKVFTLSKRHPVGIMLYNSASFMAIPWETIIKIYRDKLGETSFPTLKEYQNNFLEFLASKNYFANEEMQRNYFASFAVNIVDSIINEIAKKNRGLFDNPTEENKQQVISLLEQQLNSLKGLWQPNTNTCPNFETYTFESFKLFADVVFEQIITSRFTERILLKNSLPVDHTGRLKPFQQAGSITLPAVQVHHPLRVHRCCGFRQNRQQWYRKQTLNA